MSMLSFNPLQSSEERFRRIRRRIAVSARLLLIPPEPPPERLALALPDLNTADPGIAHDMYCGRFFLAGKCVEVGGENPFLVHADEEWKKELNSFNWLRHFSALNDSLSRIHARQLAFGWIERNRKPRRNQAWEIEIAAKRLIAWLCHSPLLAENAGFAEYRTLMKSIGQHIRLMKASLIRSQEGYAALMASIALAYAEICIGKNRDANESKQARQRLETELERQILPDGGHVSRNPAILPELLALLLPLREAQKESESQGNAALVPAVDRMMAGLRFFRMGGGTLARFNGASNTPFDLIAAILRHDDSAGKAGKRASFSGYERIEAEKTILMMDVGRPPKGEWSKRAHAGCLAFEMTSGDRALIVNCGRPPHGSPGRIKAARTSAAHSTATINRTSMCSFERKGKKILSGPANAQCRRIEDQDGIKIAAAHDGYEKRFGIIHERSLFLSREGNELVGLDRFRRTGQIADASQSSDAAVIRFHLHPDVNAVKNQYMNEDSALLQGPDGVKWKFTCLGAVPQIEESIFFADARGGVRTRQIVLAANLKASGEIQWSLEKIG